jgi:hypothetical protein
MKPGEIWATRVKLYWRLDKSPKEFYVQEHTCFLCLTVKEKSDGWQISAFFDNKVCTLDYIPHEAFGTDASYKGWFEFIAA